MAEHNLIGANFGVLLTVVGECECVGGDGDEVDGRDGVRSRTYLAMTKGVHDERSCDFEGHGSTATHASLIDVHCCLIVC